MEQHTEAQGYLVVIEPLLDEKGQPISYGAYLPDLPGCIAAGETIEETEALIQGAVAMHLRSMERDGDPIPPPRSRAIMVPAHP